MSFFHNDRLRRVLGSREGQLSLILILIVAVALIFFAVTLNWARVTSMKTMTTVASNIGAARLASNMASYGESPVQTFLEGKRKKCSWSPFFAKLLVVGIIVAILLVSIFCQACGVFLASHGAGLATLILSAVAASAALVLQGAIIEPGINSMWNKFQAQITTIEGQFAESAISAALQAVVSDQVRMNDISDYDMDGKWCKNAADPNCPYKISRFAYHYTKRMLGVSGPSAELLKKYKAFRAKLGEYVGDNLGVVVKTTYPDTPPTYIYQIDDTCCLDNNKPWNPARLQVVEQYCNSCCITVPLREPACGVGGAPINETTIQDLLTGTVPTPVPTTCPPVGFFKCACTDGPYMNQYPLSYDPLFCLRFHYQRAGYSAPFNVTTFDGTVKTFGKAFAAVMGIDDSVPTLTRRLDTKPNRPDLMPFKNEIVLDTEFRGKDSEGKFFPFLYYMRDTLTKIKDLTYANSGDEGCHWCKETEACKVNAVQKGLFWVSQDPLGSLGYDVSAYDPAVDAPFAPNDDLKCVNRFEGFVSDRQDPTEEFPDRQIDNVEPFYDYVGEAIKEREEGVAAVTGCPGAPTPDCSADPCSCKEYGNKWRPGNDRFCSSDVSAPYFSGSFDGLCAKFNQDTDPNNNKLNACFSLTPDSAEPEIGGYSSFGYDPAVCSCQAVPLTPDPLAKTYWRDDQFDLLIQKMSDLANDTRMILLDREDKYYKEVDQWGQKAKRWVADIQYVTGELFGIKNALDNWAKGGDYANSLGCYTSAWCVPLKADFDPANTFVGMSRDEQRKTGVTDLGEVVIPGQMTYGSLRSVRMCLAYNLDNQTYFDGLAAPYQAAIDAKNAYMECVYPATLDGYAKTCPSGGGGCNCIIGTSGCCSVACVPVYPLTPVLTQGQCGLNCTKSDGLVVKDLPIPPTPPCQVCGMDCAVPPAVGTCMSGGVPIPGNCCMPWSPPSCGATTCTGTCVWTVPPNICANGTPCQTTWCPTHCEAQTGAQAGQTVPSTYFGYIGTACSYTTDCVWKEPDWDAKKLVLLKIFYQLKHGSDDNTPPATKDTWKGFKKELERNWHRTLSTKSLYSPVDTPQTMNFSGFSKILDTIRGWDTDALVGDLTLTDDCNEFYNFCRPDPARAGDPACADLAAMCVVDPIFVNVFLPDSSLLAGRQKPKLNKRYEYLNFLTNKINDLVLSLPADGWPPPLVKLTDEVKSTLDELIKTNEDEKRKPPDLPNWATYVWQSPPPKGETEGYWHAVKVEALLPRRCFVDGKRDYDNFDCCAGDGKTYGENKDKFPWVRTYSAHWKTRRCFEMWDENGCVKVRVSRFDEDRSLRGSVIKFLNGVPLWKFLHRHPLHAGDDLDPILQRVGSDLCADNDKNAPGAYITGNADTDPTAADCYPAVDALIKQGFISETCARYDLQPDPMDPDNRWTYDIMFRDCKNCCRKEPQFHKLQDD